MTWFLSLDQLLANIEPQEAKKGALGTSRDSTSFVSTMASMDVGALDPSRRLREKAVHRFIGSSVPRFVGSWVPHFSACFRIKVKDSEGAPFFASWGSMFARSWSRRRRTGGKGGYHLLRAWGHGGRNLSPTKSVTADVI